MISKYEKCKAHCKMPNIAVDDRTHKEAKILCKSLEINLGELVQHSVTYFKKTGINPSNADNENPIKAIKELDRRIGQVVAYITKQEKEKLNPLLETLMVLKLQLGDAIKILPAAERFEAVIKSVNAHLIAGNENHKKQIALLTASHQATLEENRKERNTLIKAINNLQSEQEQIKQTISEKLGKKGFLG